MARRPPVNDHTGARDLQGRATIDRWQSAVPPIDPTSAHAGPSRQTFDYHDRSDPGWNADAFRNPRPPVPPYGWQADDARDGLLPAGTAVGVKPNAPMSVPVRPGYGPAAPLLPSSAHDPHARRVSAEEWQYRQPAIPPTGSLPSVLSGGAVRPDPPPVVAPVTAPWPAPHTPATTEADPPRARVACSFCRLRKLRCDGATPCRHCERRNIECVYASAKGKTKTSSDPSSSPQKGDGTAAAKGEKTETSRGFGDGRERGTKRAEHPTQLDGSDQDASIQSDGSRQSTKKSKSSRQTPSVLSPVTSNTSSSSSSPSQSTPSSSMPGSDLAMIQNNDPRIPMDPDLGSQDGWFDALLGMLGKSRSHSIKLVQHLLTRFVQSNAVFFGLLHAPTLLGVIMGGQAHLRADPALYLAVLAVSACDMHQDRIADERTSDMRAANEASRKLAQRLSEMAATYLQMSTARGAMLTASTGQAASILALTQPDGSTEQVTLVRMAENVVRTLKLHETVSQREPLLQDSEPDSPLYWSRPLASESPESEVKYESIVRLCWTGISHRFRKYIAKPDEGFGDTELPEFIHNIRPMAFWQPSLLPKDLPPPFFHSQDLMRRSAHLSRLAVTLAGLERLREIGEAGTPTEETLDKVREILRSLDGLESAFVRHRPRSDVERQNVLGRTLQMFCRMHVWVRLTIWRQYRLWNSPADGVVASSESDSSAPSSSESTLPPQLFQQQHPTIEFWLGVVQEMIDTMQRDLDAHVRDQTSLATTISDVDALARHVVCACELVEASRMLQPGLSQVDAALSILKRVLAVAEISAAAGVVGSALQLDDDVIAKVRTAETRRTALDSVVLEAAPVYGQLA